MILRRQRPKDFPELQQAIGNHPGVRDHFLPILNVDLDLLPLQLNLPFFLGQLFRLSNHLIADLFRAFLPCRVHEILDGHRQFIELPVKLGYFGLKRFDPLVLGLIGRFDGRLDDVRMLPDLADVPDNQILKRPCRDVPNRALSLFSFFRDVRAGVIKVLITVLILLASGLWRKAEAAMTAFQQTFQQMNMPVLMQKDWAFLFFWTQRLVCRLPELRRHDGRMFGRILLAAINDDPLVDWIRYHLLHAATDEPLIPDLAG
ncbi:MAG: hypothetical protein L6455_04145 [Kiritimatiellae bacterium]|nr:hypothetical protein [Kiritimatiellia bacterium]